MKTVTRKIILALFLPVIIVIAWASVTTSGKFQVVFFRVYQVWEKRLKPW
ncbi:hypothetical protein ACTQ32_12485 [Roseburia faecis]